MEASALERLNGGQLVVVAALALWLCAMLALTYLAT